MAFFWLDPTGPRRRRTFLLPRFFGFSPGFPPVRVRLHHFGYFWKRGRVRDFLVSNYAFFFLFESRQRRYSTPALPDFLVRPLFWSFFFATPSFLSHLGPAPATLTVGITSEADRFSLTVCTLCPSLLKSPFLALIWFWGGFGGGVPGLLCGVLR